MILHPVILICGTAQPVLSHHVKPTPAIPFLTDTEEANAFPLHSGTPPFERVFQTIHCKRNIPRTLPPSPFLIFIDTHTFNLTSFVINFRKEHELIHKKGRGKLLTLVFSENKKKRLFLRKLKKCEENTGSQQSCPNSLSFIPAIVANLPRLFEILFLRGGGKSGESVSPVPIKTSIWQSGLFRLALPHGHFKDAATSP